jgi:hypothetical protein
MSVQGQGPCRKAGGGCALAKKHEGSKAQGSGAESGQCGRCQLSDEETAKRAYELWLSRGLTLGHDVDDWLEAERGLRDAHRRERHGAAA